MRAIRSSHQCLPGVFSVLLVRPGIESSGNKADYLHFIASAQEAGVDLALIDYAEGLHGFDIRNDTNRAREIRADTLAYLREHLIKD